MGQPILTSEQSRKAMHYSVLWLEREIQEIAVAIENCNNEAVKGMLVARKAELERDFAEFVKLNS